MTKAGGKPAVIRTSKQIDGVDDGDGSPDDDQDLLNKYIQRR